MMLADRGFKVREIVKAIDISLSDFVLLTLTIRELSVIEKLRIVTIEL